MRNSALSKEEKTEIEQMLTKLNLKPPVAGQVIFNLDGQGKVASAELARVVWR